MRETNNYIRLLEDKNEIGFLHDTEGFSVPATSELEGDVSLPTISIDLSRCVDSLATIDAVPTSEAGLNDETIGLHDSTVRSSPPHAEEEKESREIQHQISIGMSDGHS